MSHTGDAYYFGPEKKTDLFSDTVLNIDSHSGSTFASTTTILLGDFPEVEAVFVKDMAYFVESNYEHIMASGLSAYTHTLLICRPDKAIYSNYKCGKKIPNWKFYPNEAGFSSLYKLFKYVQQMYNGSLVVVDADDLLSAPDEMMEAYCKAVGIRHDPRMTHWESGLIEEWQHAADACILISGSNQLPSRMDLSDVLVTQRGVLNLLFLVMFPMRCRLVSPSAGLCMRRCTHHDCRCECHSMHCGCVVKFTSSYFM